jgi:hypothetical protein
MSPISCIVKIILLLLLALLLDRFAYGQKTFPGTAEELLAKASAAMGKGWDTVKNLQLEGYGNEMTVDQSERFEGPYIPAQNTCSMVIDIPGKKMLVQQKSTQSIFSASSSFLVNETSMAAKSGQLIRLTLPNDALMDHLLLSPEFLFKNALQARSTLRYVKDTVLQKTTNYVLGFQWNHCPIRMYINAETAMLTAAEVTKPYHSGYAAIWGDARKIVFYSYWVLLDKNIHFPAQRDVYLNDYYLQSFLITKWKVNVPLMADSLQVPDSIQQQSREFYEKTENAYHKRMDTSARQIAEGIWLLPGPCNTTVVKQDDGLVVIESSFSSSYGEALLGKIRELFPKEKIKAFIATSDAWLHLGGIRTFATLDVPIYFPYRNEPLIRKILNAPYSTQPDLLARQGKGQYTLTGVKDLLTIGSGKNVLQLCPFNTETGDRMMMVYFPDHKIVYASDLYQPRKRDGTFWFPHYSWEVYSAIKNYHLSPDKLYAMHQAELVDFSTLKQEFDY